MSYRQQCKSARDELAKRIRSARAVSVLNDPRRTYRQAAIDCMKGLRSYNRTFGIGKAPKDGERLQ